MSGFVGLWGKENGHLYSYLGALDAASLGTTLREPLSCGFKIFMSISNPWGAGKKGRFQGTHHYGPDVVGLDWVRSVLKSDSG